jgi:hypothetical protein
MFMVIRGFEISTGSITLDILTDVDIYLLYDTSNFIWKTTINKELISILILFSKLSPEQQYHLFRNEKYGELIYLLDSRRTLESTKPLIYLSLLDMLQNPKAQ